MTILSQDESSSTCLSFSPVWEVLGPFQIGTREAIWGADPLEYLGGFRSLRSNVEARFPSSLSTGGEVSWSSQPLESSLSRSELAEATLTVGFPTANWQTLQSVYGWAALQYQAWVRGYLSIDAKTIQCLSCHIDNVLEFWIDDKPYFGGDFYAYRNAPLILYLKPGRHALDIRVIRDLRSMGSTGDPTASITMQIARTQPRLHIDADKFLISDILNGFLTSPFTSVPIRNVCQEWIKVISVTTDASNCVTTLSGKVPITLAPGQTRPLAFCIDAQGSLSALSTISFTLTYALADHPERLLSTAFTHKPSIARIEDPHKLTFIHPSGIVSYAVLKAPSKKVCSDVDRKQRLPVLLALHGAGVDANSELVRHSFDALPDLPTWTLFPSGVTSWSADDWHVWGFADVEASVKAIADWQKTVGWEGPSVHLDRWLICGHSNGQGTWYGLTHRPDKVIGAAPLSGYSSIQGYVPYQMWVEADPKITSILQGSLQDFRHELLLHNAQGIPIFLQHGTADDNVPAFHSRRMHQLLRQTRGQPSSEYAELEGKGHWFEGVMTTARLQEFYDKVLYGGGKLPALPENFSIMVANPSSMGPCGGLVVDHICSPDQLGKIEVKRDEVTATWILQTSNIFRFHFAPTTATNLPRNVVIESQLFQLPSERELLEVWFVQSTNGGWSTSNKQEWLSEQRHGAQLGALDSILRTRGHFSLQFSSARAFDTALEISRNLFQYFLADSQIVEAGEDVASNEGNIISVSVGTCQPMYMQSLFPIDLSHEEEIVIRRANGEIKSYKHRDGLGAIFLRPVTPVRLELVIWGFDNLGLRLASRLIPILTGSGQPEFIIVSKECAWKGAAGVLAMGSFDRFWHVSENSFLT